MPTAVFSPEVQGVFDNVSTVTTKQVRIGAETKTISVPFPSPADWRDQWIYFLMIDRFNNPAKPPASTQLRPPIAFDQPFGEFQGGTFEGVRQHLDYIQQLGAGAIWLSPCLKNCQYENGTYHGYGIQDFLHAEPRFASDPAAARGNPQRADDELRTLVDEVHARGMYVIFDIVLNHTGDVFGYVRDGQDNAPDAPFKEPPPYDIRWHDEHGGPGFPDFDHAPDPIPPDAAVWPSELHDNIFIRS